MTNAIARVGASLLVAFLLSVPVAKANGEWTVELSSPARPKAQCSAFANMLVERIKVPLYNCVRVKLADPDEPSRPAMVFNWPEIYAALSAEGYRPLEWKSYNPDDKEDARKNIYSPLAGIREDDPFPRQDADWARLSKHSKRQDQYMARLKNRAESDDEARRIWEHRNALRERSEGFEMARVVIGDGRSLEIVRQYGTTQCNDPQDLDVISLGGLKVDDDWLRSGEGISHPIFVSHVFEKSGELYSVFQSGDDKLMMTQFTSATEGRGSMWCSMKWQKSEELSK